MTSCTHLVSTDALNALQASDQPLMIFDASFDMGTPTNASAWFAEQHITGAVPIDLDRDLCAQSPDSAANGGRHPLPRREAWAQTLRRLGFDNTMQAIVYDRNNGMFAARLWWMLKWAGHDAVAILDGGLAAWLAAGGATASGPAPKRTTGNFKLKPPLRQWVSTEEVAHQLNQPGQMLIDARAPERWRGEVEPLDSAAGHIPGAVNRPFAQNFQPDGRYKPSTTLKPEFDALLANTEPAQTIHYCGSGVSAIPNLIAQELAGYPPGRLYAGSWSEWSSTPDMPQAKV